MSIEIKPLKLADYEAAFALATEIFARDSSLHAVLGATVADYRSYLRPSFFDMLAEGLSLVAVDTTTGQMVGVLIATDLVDLADIADLARPLPLTSAADHKIFAPIAALSAQLAQAYRAHRHIGLGEALLVDMAAVTPAMRGHQIYRQLREAAAVRAQQRGYHYVVGELSSPATQHVVINKMGHAVIAEITLADFRYEGGRPFQNITTPATIIMTEGIL